MGLAPAHFRHPLAIRKTYSSSISVPLGNLGFSLDTRNLGNLLCIGSLPVLSSTIPTRAFVLFSMFASRIYPA